jgi:hypothetical protein
MPDVSVGAKALAAMDGACLEPVVAMLAVFPEYGDWRFVISSPMLDQIQPVKAHIRVAEALNGNFMYTLPMVMILPSKEPFIRELRRLFGKGKDVTGMRLGGQRIGNRFIESAYVYRVR